LFLLYSDWVKEVTIRPKLGEFWIDWVIDDGKELVNFHPDLDYTQAIGFDRGGNEKARNRVSVLTSVFTIKLVKKPGFWQKEINESNSWIVILCQNTVKNPQRGKHQVKELSVVCIGQNWVILIFPT